MTAGRVSVTFCRFRFLPVLFLRLHDPLHIRLPLPIIQFIECLDHILLIFVACRGVHDQDDRDGHLLPACVFLCLPSRAACGCHGEKQRNRCRLYDSFFKSVSVPAHMPPARLPRGNFDRTCCSIFLCSAVKGCPVLVLQSEPGQNIYHAVTVPLIRKAVFHLP